MLVKTAVNVTVNATVTYAAALLVKILLKWIIDTRNLALFALKVHFLLLIRRLFDTELGF